MKMKFFRIQRFAWFNSGYAPMSCSIRVPDIPVVTRRGTHSVKLCEGCDIVQSDHAPQAGVAQGIFHGDLIRRRDGHQVELEEELEEEVQRRVRRNHSRDKTQVRMHG